MSDDFQHRKPSAFQNLKEEWIRKGKVIPYTSTLGSVYTEEVGDSTIFIGNINSKTLIFSVESK